MGSSTSGCIFNFGCATIFIQSSYYCHNAVLDSQRHDNINDKNMAPRKDKYLTREDVIRIVDEKT